MKSMKNRASKILRKNEIKIKKIQENSKKCKKIKKKNK